LRAASETDGAGADEEASHHGASEGQGEPTRAVPADGRYERHERLEYAGDERSAATGYVAADAGDAADESDATYGRQRSAECQRYGAQSAYERGWWWDGRDAVGAILGELGGRIQAIYGDDGWYDWVLIGVESLELDIPRNR